MNPMTAWHGVMPATTDHILRIYKVGTQRDAKSAVGEPSHIGIERVKNAVSWGPTPGEVEPTSGGVWRRQT